MTTLKVSTTKPMGHNQRQYAITRIDELQRIKGEEIDNKFPLPNLTYGDLVRLVKSGKAPLKTHINLSEECTSYRGDVDVDFSKVIDQNAVERKHSASPLYRKAGKDRSVAKQKLADTCKLAKDQIMLGDSEIGMKVLAELEAYRV